MPPHPSVGQPSEPLHVVVVTCAHRGDDARIVHRQVGALLAAGHRVTLIAPEPFVPQPGAVKMTRITVPRAVGRHRFGAWRATRRALGSVVAGEDIDVVLVHDPELVGVLGMRRVRSNGRPVPMIWDVHEDFVASVPDRSYIPALARRPVEWLVRRVEHIAARRFHLMAAEYSYQCHLGPVPVVPNSTPVPAELAAFDVDARPQRVVYVGRISIERGVREMIEIARRLRERRGDRIEFVLIGVPDAEIAAEVEAAAAEGVIIATGPIPNPDALAMVDGALAGLSLLHDIPNYHHSLPTKIAEYLAHGVPAIATALPLAAQLITESGGGIVVGHGAGRGGRLVVETVAAIERLSDDPVLRAQMGADGYAYVAMHHNWLVDGPRFVGLVEGWARLGRAA